MDTLPALGRSRARAGVQDVQRRHALPTEVWYKAYPGQHSSTSLEMPDPLAWAQNHDGTEIRQWLSEI
jgi:hypothetical protein